MAEHKFDPLSEQCVGCGVDRSNVANAGRTQSRQSQIDAAKAADCPAFYREIANGSSTLLIIVTPDEQLHVWRGGSTIFHLTCRPMFDLRDAIDDGARHVRLNRIADENEARHGKSKD
jgi:hypothetical protein